MLSSLLAMFSFAPRKLNAKFCFTPCSGASVISFVFRLLAMKSDFRELAILTPSVPSIV